MTKAVFGWVKKMKDSDYRGYLMLMMFLYYADTKWAGKQPKWNELKEEDVHILLTQLPEPGSNQIRKFHEALCEADHGMTSKIDKIEDWNRRCPEDQW